MPKISMVVPVYKAEGYIRNCISSILTQSFANFELILVDDGSPDHCPVICDEYAVQDSRIRVIHQQNSGVSAARNRGIKEATGEFICFVDSDDIIYPEYLSLLLKRIEWDEADLAVCSFVKLEKRPGVELVFEDIQFTLGDDIDNSMCFLFGNGIQQPWNKLFRRSIIVENGLSFSVGVPYSEDWMFCLDYLCCCNRVTVVSEQLYEYNTLNQNSAIKKYYDDFFSYYQIVFEKRRRVLEKHGMNPYPPSMHRKIDQEFYYANSHFLYRAPNRKIKQQKVQEAYLQFKEYLDFSCKDIHIAPYRTFFEQGNYGGFVKQWTKDHWLDYLKYKTKRLLLKLL